MALHFSPIFEHHSQKSQLGFLFSNFCCTVYNLGWVLPENRMSLNDILISLVVVLTLTLLYLAILSLTIFFYKFSELERSVKSMKHLNLWGDDYDIPFGSISTSRDRDKHNSNPAQTCWFFSLKISKSLTYIQY